MACRWLRQYGSAIGIPPDYAVLDADDARRLVAAVVKATGLDASVVRPRAVAAAISYAKNVSPLGSVDGYDGQMAWVGCIPAADRRGRDLAAAYWARCRADNALDFDDLLLATRWLLVASPDVRAALQRRYRHVLVDEWQDLNVVQYDILRLLASPSMQVWGGDDGDGSGDGGGGGRGAAGGGNSGLPGPPRRSAGLPPSGGPASVSASAALSVIAAARERLAALYERPPPGELRRLRVAVLNTLRAVAVPVSPLIADGLQAPAGWLVVAPVGARGAHLGAAALFGRDGETVTDAYVLPIAGKGGGDSGSGGGGGGDPGCRGRVGGGGHIGASAMGMGGRGGGASDGGGDGGGGRPGYRPDNLYSPARLAARRQHAAGGIVAVGSPVDGGSASGGGVRRAPSGASAVWDGPPTGGGGAAVPLHEGEALLPTGGEGDGWAS